MTLALCKIKLSQKICLFITLYKIKKLIYHYEIEILKNVDI